MIWLASFPRSGNTFFRNVLYEVYGIQSSEYHLEEDKKVKADFAEYPVVKTHLLPHQLPPELQAAKSVYLVRDGRDAITSIAHHRRDIVAPGSNMYMNLFEAILARGGSFFGGWSENVKQWSEKADILIRFEDLIADPLTQVERLRSIMDLPEPRLEQLPTFESLKFGTPQYGSGEHKVFTPEAKKLHAQKFYRRGKVGSFRDELPYAFQLLFWWKHRRQMKKMGYY